MSLSPVELHSISNDIGYTFRNTNLLLEALTHPSVVFKARKNKKSQPRFNYERLEFLGDKVMGMIIAEELFKKYRYETEGQISKRFGGIVCGKVCTEIAKRLKLDTHMIFSKGEINHNGRNISSNLEDGLEALIGAIFLDSGITIVTSFVLKLFHNYIDGDGVEEDSKSFLQEWSQEKFGILPQYDVINESGPDHSKIFTVKVCTPNELKCSTGKGASKKEAEKDAAKNFIDLYIKNIKC